MVYILQKNRNKRIINRILNSLFLKIDNENIDGHTIIYFEKNSPLEYRKLKKFIDVNCLRTICVSEKLKNNNDFINFLKEEDVSFFTGKWIIKFLITNIIEFICNNKKEKIELQDISILTNHINEEIVDTINELAFKVKNISIVTKNRNKFLKIEKKLFEDNGIVLNISNNYNKSLIRSNIIINYDFNEEELNKYKIYQNACLININDNIKKLAKSFNGIIVNSININMPDCKNILGDVKEEFDNTIFYESYIYKNTIAKNIKQEIKKDKIVINSLNGINGVINKKEFLKLNNLYSHFSLILFVYQ